MTRVSGETPRSAFTHDPYRGDTHYNTQHARGHVTTQTFFFFFLTTVKTRRASLNNLSSSQLRTAIGRSLLADRLTGYPAGPCARIPQASWSTTPAVGGYLIPRESAVPKSG